MRQEELNKILGDHKLWVESKGEKGRQANLEGADLTSAKLQGAILHGANLKKAHLFCAILLDSNLKGANLEGAYLEGANLKDVNLSGANLIGANLVATNLKGAKFTTEIRNVSRFSHCEITKDQLPWLALHPKFSEFYPTLTVFE